MTIAIASTTTFSCDERHFYSSTSIHSMLVLSLFWTSWQNTFALFELDGLFQENQTSSRLDFSSRMPQGPCIRSCTTLNTSQPASGHQALKTVTTIFFCFLIPVPLLCIICFCSWMIMDEPNSSSVLIFIVSFCLIDSHLQMILSSLPPVCSKNRKLRLLIGPWLLNCNAARSNITKQVSHSISLHDLASGCSGCTPSTQHAQLCVLLLFFYHTKIEVQYILLRGATKRQPNMIWWPCSTARDSAYYMVMHVHHLVLPPYFSFQFTPSMQHQD
jgi:hypothetical protein